MIDEKPVDMMVQALSIRRVGEMLSESAPDVASGEDSSQSRVTGGRACTGFPGSHWPDTKV